MNTQQALSAYLNAVADAVQSQNAARVENLLSLSNELGLRAVQAGTLAGAGSFRPGVVCQQRFKSIENGLEWAKTIVAHTDAMLLFHTRQYPEAYAKMVEGSEPLRSLFEGQDDYWMVRVLIAFAKNLSAIARLADAVLRKQNTTAETMSRCADEVRKYFPIMNRSKVVGKKAGALAIVNLLCKTYFQMNSVRLCKNLIRAMDTPQALAFDRFPIAQKVTYKFFLGRLAIFDEDFTKAEELLAWALKFCHPNAVGNRARILNFLVPVKMLTGQLPTAYLIQQYGLEQYAPVVSAMRTGDVGLLDTHLQTHQYRFIQAGTYLLLEKLRQHTLRRLLKSVQVVRRDMVEASKANQIPLGAFQAALSLQGVEMDMDEIECVVANLIYMGYVRGYMSHKQKVVVVSKQLAFPPLHSIVARDL